MYVFLFFFLICMSFSMFLIFYRIFVQFGILGWICNAIGILNPFVDCQIHRFFDFLLASGRTLIPECAYWRACWYLPAFACRFWSASWLKCNAQITSKNEFASIRPQALQTAQAHCLLPLTWAKPTPRAWAHGCSMGWASLRLPPRPPRPAPGPPLPLPGSICLRGAYASLRAAYAEDCALFPKEGRQ